MNPHSVNDRRRAVEGRYELPYFGPDFTPTGTKNDRFTYNVVPYSVMYNTGNGPNRPFKNSTERGAGTLHAHVTFRVFFTVATKTRL